MTKRLPPPGGNGSKLPSRRPPPGHPALNEDFFVRFHELTDVYDTMVKQYKELKHVSGSHHVRWRMHSLEPWGDNDEDVVDRLQWLWPAVENIHAPPRDYYAKRASFLVGSFPSAAPHSPQAFIKMLVSSILVKAPSCMVLESACFELTTTYKYSNAPNIADLMTLIDKHNELWDERLWIHNEIESGRARKFAERRLAYEEEQEQKKIDRTIARLEKLNENRNDPDDMVVEDMIADLREHGIDALDENYIDELVREELKRQEEEKQKRKEADPNWIAIQAWLKQFKLHQWHHDELVETVYKAAIKEAKPIEAILAKKVILPNTLDNINEGLALDYLRTRDFIEKATFETLDLHIKEKPKPQMRWPDPDDDEEQPRRGKRIRF
jgi:hypothetical protein